MDFTALFSIERLVSSLAMTLIHFCWQAAIVAFVLKTILSLSKKQALKLRYYSAVIALGACVLLPVYTFSLFYQASETASLTFDAAAIQNAVLPGVSQSLSTDANGVTNPGIWSQISPFFDFQFLVALWALGVCLMLAKLVYDLRQTYRLTRVGTSPVDSEIKQMVKQITHRFEISRPVRVLKSTLVNVPVVIGWFKPTVLLPIAITIGLDRQQLELIIAHELAHVKRLDFLVNLVQGFIQVIFFYHPCVYWINKIVREEREYICDSMALTTLNNSPSARLELAKALLNIEELKEGNLPLVAVAASDGHLKNRISRIVINDRLQFPSSKGVLVAAISLLFSFAAIAVTSDMSARQSGEQLTDITSDDLLVNNLNTPINRVNSSLKSTKLKESPALVLDDNKATLKADNSRKLVSSVSTNNKPSIKTSDKPTNKSIESQTIAKAIPAPVKVSKKKPTVVDKSQDKSFSTDKVVPLLSKKSPDAAPAITTKVVPQVTPKIDEPLTVASKDLANQSELKTLSNKKLALLDAKSAVNFKEPIALRTPFPVYPPAAYRKRLQGNVSVEFLITEEGRVIEPEFNDAAHRFFVREIKSKLRKWRYKPAVKDGNPIAHKISIDFNFEVPQYAPASGVQTGTRLPRGS